MAIDYRFGWLDVSRWALFLGDVLFVIGFGLVGRVHRENSSTSATIEVAQGHRVISTGPYSIVRHPMYASASLYLIGTPLALGSYWGLLVLAGMLPLVVWRLRDEERLLAAELPGYTDYQKRVAVSAGAGGVVAERRLTGATYKRMQLADASVPRNVR